MEACTDNDRSAADRTSQPCDTALVPGKKRTSRFREIASDCVFWTGMALIGIAAIPAGILFGIIYLLLKAMNYVTDKIEKN